ncbi:hypothetical protein [Nonomuraea sp. NPDC005650]|uniref:hypothetical protein n=1 Tax=Nonomuraea sp. NPDC005650 TaxID=3157045 RepID=UPI0033BD8017
MPGVPELDCPGSSGLAFKRMQQERVSHAYHPGAAVRLICWFPPDTEKVVVALFARDKANLGDLFYDSVAARADGLIDQWKRETCGCQEFSRPMRHARIRRSARRGGHVG